MEGYYRGDEIVDWTTYPSGETHLAIKPEFARRRAVDHVSPMIIEWSARTWGDIVGLCLVDDRFRELNYYVRWFLPYLPFARDDRRRTTGSTNGLDFAIDLLKRRDVLIVDPHSYVAARLPHLPQAACVKAASNAGLLPEDPVILVPDAGARAKMDWLLPTMTVIQGEKNRDPFTGMLSGFAIRNADEMRGRDVLIVDDIIDGGGTFLGLLEIAAQHAAHSVTLLVSHGLFTNGTEPLGDFNRIITFGAGATAPNIERIPWERLFEENFCNDE